MPSERLSILAAAAALGEFTVPELAAYSGAKPATVDQVLRRAENRFLSNSGSPGKRGRPARLWRTTDRGAILAELAQEQTALSSIWSLAEGLESGRSPSDPVAISDSDPTTRTDLEGVESLVSAGERALAQAILPRDPADRPYLVETSLNFLTTANEELHRLRQGSRSPAADGHFIGEAELAGRETSSRELASVLCKHTQGSHITSRDLRDTAWAVANVRGVISEDAFKTRCTQLVRISLEAGHPPQMVVLTDRTQSPSDLFPSLDSSEWTGTELVLGGQGSACVAWLEDWTIPLREDLVEALVVSHEDTVDSNNLLEHILNEIGASTAWDAAVPPATIVASTADNADVAGLVAASGATFYPLRSTKGGLRLAVDLSILRALGPPSNSAAHILDLLTPKG
jgi:hypothetical protein